MTPPALHPAPLPSNLSHILSSFVTPKKSMSFLTDLYTSTHSTLPATILSRSPSPHLLHEDLIAIMDAKLTFGQNRPALRGMIAKLSPKDVVSTSTAAFKALSDTTSSSSSRDRIEKSLKALLPLRGVGPATASLILSLVSEEVPFFSDEAAVEVLKPAGGRNGLKYTLPEYWKFFEEVGREAEGGEGGRRGWERHVWGVTRVLEAGAGKSDAGKKRARGEEHKEKVVLDQEEEPINEVGRPKRSKKSV